MNTQTLNNGNILDEI